MTSVTKFITIVLAVIALAISSAKANNANPRDNVAKMLEAINKIRSARDITLDCADYVDRYIGHSDTIGHYFDVFAAAGVPVRYAYNGPRYFTYFEIGASRLRQTPGSQFGRRDRLVINFETDSARATAHVESCKAVLFAAVPYI